MKLPFEGGAAVGGVHVAISADLTNLKRALDEASGLLDKLKNSAEGQAKQIEKTTKITLGNLTSWVAKLGGALLIARGVANAFGQIHKAQQVTTKGLEGWIEKSHIMIRAIPLIGSVISDLAKNIENVVFFDPDKVRRDAELAATIFANTMAKTLRDQMAAQSESISIQVDLLTQQTISSDTGDMRPVLELQRDDAVSQEEERLKARMELQKELEDNRIKGLRANKPQMSGLARIGSTRDASSTTIDAASKAYEKYVEEKKNYEDDLAAHLQQSDLERTKITGESIAMEDAIIASYDKKIERMGKELELQKEQLRLRKELRDINATLEEHKTSVARGELGREVSVGGGTMTVPDDTSGSLISEMRSLQDEFEDRMSRQQEINLLKQEQEQAGSSMLSETYMRGTSEEWLEGRISLLEAEIASGYAGEQERFGGEQERRDYGNSMSVGGGLVREQEKRERQLRDNMETERLGLESQLARAVSEEGKLRDNLETERVGLESQLTQAVSEEGKGDTEEGKVDTSVSDALRERIAQVGFEQLEGDTSVSDALRERIDILHEEYDVRLDILRLQEEKRQSQISDNLDAQIRIQELQNAGGGLELAFERLQQDYERTLEGYGGTDMMDESQVGQLEQLFNLKAEALVDSQSKASVGQHSAQSAIGTFQFSTQNAQAETAATTKKLLESLQTFFTKFNAPIEVELEALT